jgi:cytochrome c
MDSPIVLYGKLLGLLVVLTAIVSFNFAVWGLRRPAAAPLLSVPEGQAERGCQLLQHHDCGSCHTVPGVRSAIGKVGPPLDHVREHAYIGGVLPNSPQNLISWIMNPKASDPATAMPDLDVNDRDARDIATFLYQLR